MVDVAPFLMKLSDADLIGFVSKNWTGKAAEKALEFTLSNKAEVSSFIGSAECDKLQAISCVIDKGCADGWLRKNRPHLWEIAQDLMAAGRNDLTLTSDSRRFTPH
jgi:hypothetical protein